MKNLAITETGGLLASVRGTELYDVHVEIDETGSLSSVCTCPYPGECKHAVATVLEYLHRHVRGETIPVADPADMHCALSTHKHLEEDADDEYDKGEDEDEDEEGEEGEEKNEIRVCSYTSENQRLVKKLLASKTKDELIKLLLGFAREETTVANTLLNMAQLQVNDVSSVIKHLEKEIDRVSCEESWSNSWSGEGYTPDYSHIGKGLRTLLEVGHADEVLELAQKILSQGSVQIEESYDEGELQCEISRCLEVLPKALAASSLAEPARILWAIDTIDDDQYDLAPDLKKYLDWPHPASVWSEVADSLIERLKRSDIDRSTVSERIIDALTDANRNDEIIPFCEQEAPITKSYARLVKRLIDADRFQDAEFWIRSGTADPALEQYEGSKLRELLVMLRLRQEDWPSLMLLQTENFVANPSKATFLTCKETAEHLGRWAEIRSTLLHYLESGCLPWDNPAWHLPMPDPSSSTSRHSLSFPAKSYLLEIALCERNIPEILRWYALYQQNSRGFKCLDNEVASAVQMSEPDLAVKIWKSKAESEIATVEPRAYQVAAIYLEKAGKIMKREHRSGEWEQYLRELRKEHRRKRRLLEVLDTLDGTTIEEQMARKRKK
ncbi:MAG: hypothetical protein K6G15_12170 [Desulfovibrio sp.]|nr:hypothetical protein [Desulfovibrio sp.]